MGIRIATDLADPSLVRFLKPEVHDTAATIKGALTRALEAWFADRLKHKALAKLAVSSFSDWDDLRDAEYDRL